MSFESAASGFAGSVPQIYERYLVPLIFEDYADDLAARARGRSPARILEIAAGTGVVTRRLASVLPPKVAVVATDLNQAMLDQAAAVGTTRPVEWRQADAMQLPFEDASFDLVLCQFGTMFFPDRPKAYAEARRVLRPGGAFIFSVWDGLERNEFAAEVHRAVARLFPADPPSFLERLPYAYHDFALISADLARAGFGTPAIQTLPARSRADSPLGPAMGYCQGTPLRNEIEARSPGALEQVTQAATAAIAQRFGPGPVDAAIQAHIITVEHN